MATPMVQKEQRSDTDHANATPAQDDQAAASPDKAAAIKNAAQAVVKRLGSDGQSQPQQGEGQGQGAPKVGIFERILGIVKQGGDEAIDKAKTVEQDTVKLATGIKDHLIDFGGQAVGVAELAGLKYPVTTYEKQVSGGLWRGSRLQSPSDADHLKEQGIKATVNLCLEMSQGDTPFLGNSGLQTLHIPILDNSSPSMAQVQQFLSYVQGSGPVYVHCEAGKGRTGTMCACYRIAVEGWTADKAIEEYKSLGGALPNQIEFIEKFASAQKAG